MAQHHERRGAAEDRDPRLAGPPPYAYGYRAVRRVEIDGRQQPGPRLLVASEPGGHREEPPFRGRRQVFGRNRDRYATPDQGASRARTVGVEGQQFARPVVHAGDQAVREGEEAGVLGEVAVVHLGPFRAVGEVQQADPPGDMVGDEEPGR